MKDCIFCKIISGEIPSSKVYEDDHVLAFLDISQTTKGHTLIIPKKHSRNLLEINPESAQYLFSQVSIIAQHLQKKLGATGLNLINNNEESAGQTVFHTHLHLIPRYDTDDNLTIKFTINEPDFEKLAQLSQLLYLEK